MAFDGTSLGLKIGTFTAGADLSAKQFFFVKQSGTTVVLCSAVTDFPLGILLNNPVSGEQAEVGVVGNFKLSTGAGGALAVGNLVGTDTAGQGAAYVNGTDTTKYLVGRVIQASSATQGSLASVLIDCISPNRGA